MKKIDWKKVKEFWGKRIKNKYFWISLGSIVVLASQTFGVDLSGIPVVGDYENVVNAIFAMLTALGVAVNTSTEGLGD